MLILAIPMLKRRRPRGPRYAPFIHAAVSGELKQSVEKLRAHNHLPSAALTAPFPFLVPTNTSRSHTPAPGAEYEDQSDVVAICVWQLHIQGRDPMAVRAKDTDIISYADLLRVVLSKKNPGAIGGVRRLFVVIDNHVNIGIEPSGIAAR